MFAVISPTGESKAPDIVVGPFPFSMQGHSLPVMEPEWYLHYFFPLLVTLFCLIWGIEVTLVMPVAHGSSGLCPRANELQTQQCHTDCVCTLPRLHGRDTWMNRCLGRLRMLLPYLGYLPPLSTMLYELEKGIRVSPSLRLKRHPSACKRMSSAWQRELGRRGRSTQECERKLLEGPSSNPVIGVSA